MNLATQPSCQLRLHTPEACVPTILCIDDDPDITRAIELHLRRFEVNVVRAYHGMQGFFEAMKGPPDLIILDLTMPGGDGATILDCLRRNRQTSAVPVIVLTGMRDHRLRRRLFELGADQYIRKPIHVDQLTHEISRFIDLRPRADDLDEQLDPT